MCCLISKVLDIFLLSSSYWFLLYSTMVRKHFLNDFKTHFFLRFVFGPEDSLSYSCYCWAGCSMYVSLIIPMDCVVQLFCILADFIQIAILMFWIVKSDCNPVSSISFYLMCFEDLLLGEYTFRILTPSTSIHCHHCIKQFSFIWNLLYLILM